MAAHSFADKIHVFDQINMPNYNGRNREYSDKQVSVL